MRIAVIGAGVSGLTAALALKERGFRNVVVFEKEERVGGKTFSLAYKGTQYDLGSMMFSRPCDISRLADQYRVPYTPFETKDFYYSKGEWMNPIAYAKQSTSWLDLALSLVGLHQIIHANHLTEPGFRDVSPELFQDFEGYLHAHHLEAAAHAFEPAVAGLGYGYFSTTPAMYGLKIMASMMDVSLMRSLLTNGGLVCFFPGGWMELWEKVAADLHVRLGAQITAIDRSSGQDVRITVNGKDEVFDRVIVTTPLNHAQAYLDLSEEESRLFPKIRSHRMISTLIEGSVPLHTGFLVDQAVPQRLGHVLGIEAYAPETKCAVLFQTAAPETSIEEICDTLTADLREFGCDVKQIVHQKDWEYFYHVSAQDLREGFYPSLEKLQGLQCTYYAGSIMNYETVGHCQQYAKYLVETYFSK